MPRCSTTKECFLLRGYTTMRHRVLLGLPLVLMTMADDQN